MSTKRDTVERLKEVLAGAGAVRFKPMFGEYGIYLDEKFIGCVADDLLFLKKTEAGGRMIGEGHEAPPYPGASLHYCVPEERLGDPDWVCEFLRVTAEGLVVKKKARKGQDHRPKM